MRSPRFDGIGMNALKTAVTYIAVRIDRLLNCLIGGSIGETVTKHAARSMREGKRWGCVLCWLLDKIDKGHCRRFG